MQLTVTDLTGKSATKQYDEVIFVDAIENIEDGTFTIPDGTVKVYHFHPETFELGDIEDAYIFNNHVICKDPEHSTIVECHRNYEFSGDSDYINFVYDQTQKQWNKVEDYRNFTLTYDEHGSHKHARVKTGYYLPLEGDDPDVGPVRFNDTLGPLPEGAVKADQLPNRYVLIERITKRNEYQFMKRVNKLIVSTLRLDGALASDNVDLFNNSYNNYRVHNLVEAMGIISSVSDRLFYNLSNLFKEMHYKQFFFDLLRDWETQGANGNYTYTIQSFMSLWGYTKEDFEKLRIQLSGIIDTYQSFVLQYNVVRGIVLNPDTTYTELYKTYKLMEDTHV